MILKNVLAARVVLAVFTWMMPFSLCRAEEFDPTMDLWAKGVEVAGYLFIFVVLAALAVHLTRRYQPSWGAPGPIHVVDGRNLGPGMGIRLVRIGARAWLLGVTRERISLLAELDAADLPRGKTREVPVVPPLPETPESDS
ncbi:MAG: flagellar biosynthetic protein FliO [Magnetococcales bacterium]|nr:flagellar biosynthetic protein FliO [Magnetococcales bacterium]